MAGAARQARGGAALPPTAARRRSGLARSRPGQPGGAGARGSAAGLAHGAARGGAVALRRWCAAFQPGRRRRRGQAAGARSAEAGGCGARGSGLRAPHRAAHGARIVVAARPRRRGGAPAAAAPDSSREEVGEGEEVAAELTVGSIWADEVRERGLDGEGRSSTKLQWRSAVCSFDSG